MRRYHRPLIVALSALALASLVSYAAIELTEPKLGSRMNRGLPFCDMNRPIRIRHVIEEAKVHAGLDEGAPGRIAPEKTYPFPTRTYFCDEGRSIRRSHPDAQELKNIEAFRKASIDAFGGEPRKLVALANFYLMGIGTEKNEAEAARIYWIGAEKGDSECQAKLKALIEKTAPASR